MTHIHIEDYDYDDELNYIGLAPLFGMANAVWHEPDYTPCNCLDEDCNDPTSAFLIPS